MDSFFGPGLFGPDPLGPIEPSVLPPPLEPDLLPTFSPLDALEQHIENSVIPPGAPLEDQLSLLLTQLEENIETSVVKPPPAIEEPEPPTLAGPLMQQSSDEGPPLPPESTERPWGTLVPPLAARPYFSFHGLTTPSHRTRGRGGTGIRCSSTEQSDKTFCPLWQDLVLRTTCKDCKHYDPDTTVCTYYHEDDSEESDSVAEENLDY